MQRLIVFMGGISHVPAVVMAKILQEVKCRPDLELAAICLPKAPNYRKTKRRHLKQKIKRSLASIRGVLETKEITWPPPINVKKLERLYGTKLLIPPSGDPNDPGFIEKLRVEIRPTVALCFYYIKKFSPELLAVLESSVNYHNGLLPSYKGLKATAWSVYNKEKETGFSFHYMAEELDQGQILLSGTIPVCAEDTGAWLDFQKILKAAEMIPTVIEDLLNGKTGESQAADGRYYSIQDFNKIETIDDPSLLTMAEIELRVKAFGQVKINVQGILYRVKKVQPASQKTGGKRCPRVVCADDRLIDLLDYRQESHKMASKPCQCR